jgi:hypothetical protein
MYELSTSLNKNDNDMLWLAIVGMTDLIVHSKLGTYDQDDDNDRFNDEVQRLNPNIYFKNQ